MDRFDPFEILQLPEDATDADIKRAYRRLSLQYHPGAPPLLQPPIAALPASRLRPRAH